MIRIARALVLQWFYTGFTVVGPVREILHSTRSGFTMVLQWFYNGFTVVVHWCCVACALPEACLNPSRMSQARPVPS